jgi:hypothetical protein
MKYLGYACCLIVTAWIVLSIAGRWMDFRWFTARRVYPPTSVVCAECHGTGWIELRERTLNFTGDSFADVQRPPTMCEACGGTGQVFR